MSNQVQPDDVVRATRCLKLRVGARKGADAKTVTQALDLATRRENRGSLGRAIPWTQLFLQKAGGAAIWVLGVHI